MPDVRRSSPALAAALMAAVLAIATACEDDPPEPAPAPPTSTPLSELATDTVAVAREDFCARVAPAAVEQALGAPPVATRTWANGERAHLAPGVTDVAHEYGCAWTAGSTAVRAWVFAPPVTPGQAEDLRRAAARAPGCTPVPQAPRFGSPSVAVRCTGAHGETTAFHGLFGDAWLSCTLEAGPGPATRADLLERAGRWCATALGAAAA